MNVAVTFLSAFITTVAVVPNVVSAPAHPAKTELLPGLAVSFTVVEAGNLTPLVMDCPRAVAATVPVPEPLVLMVKVYWV